MKVERNMGQIPSCENVHQNMEIIHDEVTRQARLITEITTLNHKDLEMYIESINNLSKRCMDAEGKQLTFYIKKGSDNGLLWKNNVRIMCIRYEPIHKKIISLKCMSLNQFLKLYRSLNMQFKAAEQLYAEQGEEATCNLTHLNSASLMKDIDDVVASPSECCICFERQQEVMLPCFHSFCQECILNWNSCHKTCPICREIIRNDKDSWVICDIPTGFEIEEELVASIMDIIKSDNLEKD